jgi:hypothetical protein
LRRHVSAHTTLNHCAVKGIPYRRLARCGIRLNSKILRKTNALQAIFDDPIAPTRKDKADGEDDYAKNGRSYHYQQAQIHRSTSAISPRAHIAK